MERELTRIPCAISDLFWISFDRLLLFLGSVWFLVMLRHDVIIVLGRLKVGMRWSGNTMQLVRRVESWSSCLCCLSSTRWGSQGSILRVSGIGDFMQTRCWQHSRPCSEVVGKRSGMYEGFRASRVCGMRGKTKVTGCVEWRWSSTHQGMFIGQLVFRFAFFASLLSFWGVKECNSILCFFFDNASGYSWDAIRDVMKKGIIC